uniref:Endoribonuclease n=1 Tax=Meloidogyne javanica TaxID=6303 RepID=A0A915LXB9_MELJA
MYDFWFGTYSRCEQDVDSEPLGSSGFEHVFSGEWKDRIGVDGHHNWLRYYLQEKAGEINYYGYFEHQNNNILGAFQYEWKGYLKRIGGFFFRTSPAFDLTLFTVCSILHPGYEACQFELLNTKMVVTSFKKNCDKGTCLSTAYPALLSDILF